MMHNKKVYWIFFINFITKFKDIESENFLILVTEKLSYLIFPHSSEIRSCANTWFKEKTSEFLTHFTRYTLEKVLRERTIFQKKQTDQLATVSVLLLHLVP